MERHDPNKNKRSAGACAVGADVATLRVARERPLRRSPGLQGCRGGSRTAHPIRESMAVPSPYNQNTTTRNISTAIIVGAPHASPA